MSFCGLRKGWHSRQRSETKDRASAKEADEMGELQYNARGRSQERNYLSTKRYFWRVIKGCIRTQRLPGLHQGDY